MTDRSLASGRKRTGADVTAPAASGNHLRAHGRDADGDEPDSQDEVQSLRAEVARLASALSLRTAELQALQQSLRPAPPSSDPARVTPTPEVAPESRRTAPPSRRHGGAIRSVQLTVNDSGRRESSRFPCRLDVEFTHEAEFYAGITQDISEGGLFVATYNLLPLGTELVLHLELGSGEKVEVRGTVRWLRETHTTATRPGMGIQFNELSVNALSTIQRFCRERAPLYIETAEP